MCFILRWCILDYNVNVPQGNKLAVDTTMIAFFSNLYTNHIFDYVHNTLQNKGIVLTNIYIYISIVAVADQSVPYKIDFASHKEDTCIFLIYT